MNTANGTSNQNAASFNRILHWLTGAYPNGVPAEDRAALIVLLSNRISADQIYTAMSILTPEVIDPGVERFITREQVDQTIADTTVNPPTSADQRRVAATVASAGWPLNGTV